jgi:hypothetical protein
VGWESLGQWGGDVVRVEPRTAAERWIMIATPGGRADRGRSRRRFQPGKRPERDVCPILRAGRAQPAVHAPRPAPEPEVEIRALADYDAALGIDGGVA